MVFKTLTVPLLLFFLFSCHAQESKTNKEMSFKSIDEQAKVLTKYHQASLNSIGEEKQKNEQYFFEAFPNSFTNMQELFGDDDEKGQGPLYSQEMEQDGIINHFQNLSTISKGHYYNKYINICIGGVWEADNITDCFGLGAKIRNDTKSVISVLSQKSKKEIRSVFRFLFDGPHPDNRMESYKIFYNKIKSVDPSMAELIKQEYEKLLEEDDGHGH